MSIGGLTTGIVNWFSNIYNRQPLEDSQTEKKISPSQSAPLPDKQIEKLREDAIDSLMKERALSREVAESQIDALS